MTPLRLGLVDYGMGNLASVAKALEHVAGPESVRMVRSPDEAAACDGLVLPGVGAFGQAVRNLRRAGLFRFLQDWVSADKPFLGICLGYQLLFGSSEESPGVRGLAVFPGRVVRFRTAGLKVPHIGWNTVEGSLALLQGIRRPAWFYFVHSFYPVPGTDAVGTLRTEYGGEEFVSAVGRGAVFGVQFHPEKSQNNGLKVLRNFRDLCRRRTRR